LGSGTARKGVQYAKLQKCRDLREFRVQARPGQVEEGGPLLRSVASGHVNRLHRLLSTGPQSFSAVGTDTGGVCGRQPGVPLDSGCCTPCSSDYPARQNSHHSAGALVLLVCSQGNLSPQPGAAAVDTQTLVLLDELCTMVWKISHCETLLSLCRILWRDPCQHGAWWRGQCALPVDPTWFRTALCRSLQTLWPTRPLPQMCCPHSVCSILWCAIHQNFSAISSLTAWNQHIPVRLIVCPERRCRSCRTMHRAPFV
jgi:hypothetical protein